MNIDNFSNEHFIAYVSNIYVQVNRAVMFKELDKIKHFVSDDVYLKLSNVVKTLISNGYIQFYDEMNVREVAITNCSEDSNYDYIEIDLTSRYMDYIMKDGKLISGNNKSTIMKNNKMIFSRRKDYNKQAAARKCSGCGANIDVNRNGNCDYCGATYNLEDMDWTLSSFETY